MEEPVMRRLALAAALVLQACATPPAPEPEPIAPAPVARVFEPVPAPPPVVLFVPKPGSAAASKAGVPPGDLWERIRRGFAMPDLDGPLVRTKTRQYAAQPEYLQRIFDRSRLYLFHIVEEIEKRGMPT